MPEPTSLNHGRAIVVDDRERLLAAPPSDDLATDLMRRVGVAIDEWAIAHGLQNLPKDIILAQVMTALKAMREAATTDRPKGS